jgi:poly-beta-1,6-N-acetyl-D-glucosamine synthase
MILLVITLVLLFLYGASLLLILYKLKQEENGDRSKISYFPEFSIIIAARNEEANICPILDFLRAQKYPASAFEVIIVDDHSEDDTALITGEYKNVYPDFSLKLVALGENDTGKKSAIAKGIENALFPWIITTDADCKMESDWLVAKAEIIHNSNYKLIISPVFAANVNHLIEKIQQVEWVVLMGLTLGSLRSGFPLMCNGANLCYNRSVIDNDLKESLNFKIASGDDLFLLQSVIKNYGSKNIGSALKSVVYTEVEQSFNAILQQKVRWASKSVYYKDVPTLLYGLLVSFINLFVVFIPILGWFQLLNWGTLGILGLMKIITDIVFGYFCSTRLNQKINLKALIIYALVYPWYFCGIIIIGMFLKKSWKGRSVK